MICVYYMMGEPKGSTESGSGEAGNQTCDPWITTNGDYPLHNGSFYIVIRDIICILDKNDI